MSYAKVRNDFLSEGTSKEQATAKLVAELSPSFIARRLVELWQVVQRLTDQRELGKPDPDDNGGGRPRRAMDDEE